jgi:hypothetical protein
VHLVIPTRLTLSFASIGRSKKRQETGTRGVSLQPDLGSWPMRSRIGIACLLVLFSTLLSCGGGDANTSASATGGARGTDTSGSPGTGTSGPPGSGTGGIEGTGIRSIVSNGVITGLGSIIVEGVEYALNTSGIEGTGLNKTTITVNGQPGTAADLVVGEVVTLTATAGSDTAHANAVSVIYDTDIQGPIEAVINNGSHLTILGQLVDLDAEETWKVGDTVAVSGFRNADSVWLAKRITPVNSGSLVVSGIVKNVDTTAKTLAIGTLSVDYSGATLRNFAGDPQVGVNVRVTGSRRNDATLQANTVVRLDPALPGAEGDSAYIEGWVTDLTSRQEFDVNNHHVVTSASTLFGPSSGVTLSTASFVQVSGLRRADGGVDAFNVNVCNMSPISGTTATLMRNGKVLLLGGDPCGYFAEIFDTSTSTFASAGRMATTRFAPLVTMLADGRVLIAGGYGGQYTTYADGSTSTYSPLTTTEIYDPVSGRFSDGPSMPQIHVNGTATLLSDGRVLIAGGLKNVGMGAPTTDTAELLDAAATKFTAVGFMATQRAGHTATLLSDGTVLMVGGWKGHPADDWEFYPLFAELFDPSLGTFKTTGSMSAARSGHMAFLISGNAVLVFGGTGGSSPYAEIYHVAARGFTPFSMPQQPQVASTVTQLRDGQLLFLGGQIGNDPVDTAVLLNPVTGTTVSTVSLKAPRAGHTATLLDDGRVLVIGGIGPAGSEIPPFEYWSPMP